MKWWNTLPSQLQIALMLYVNAKSGNTGQTYYGVGMQVPWPGDDMTQNALCRAYMELKELFS